MHTIRNNVLSPDFQLANRNGTKTLDTFEGKIQNWTIFGIPEEKLRNGTAEDTEEELSNRLDIPFFGDNEKSLLPENINRCLKAMEYAPRGALDLRAIELEKQLAQGDKLPFTEMIKANLGDAHAMGQKPITFLRQVICLMTYPELIDTINFPIDVKDRARSLLAACRGGSIGSYSGAAGMEIVRQHVSEYIQRRDNVGTPTHPDNIFLCNGASEGIRAVLKLLKDCNSENGLRSGVMLPVPQFPLYSATSTEYDLHQILYHLEENRNWALDIVALKRAVTESRTKCNPRAIVIINPGNPTGQVLTRENIIEIVKFAYNERLCIIADEVYQDNIYAAGSKFYSVRKILYELGAPYNSVELISVFSTAKGYMGECGVRSGYVELVNIDPEVKKVLLKGISLKSCPNVMGQSAMDCVVNPPRLGDPSYELFIQEKTTVLNSLKARANIVADALNQIPGFTCNPVQGAMYAFPKIELPEKVIKAARAKGLHPDMFYAFELLETAGICILAGSGFDQAPGTFHFRMTILPREDLLKQMIEKIKAFHIQFLAKYTS